MSHQDYFIYKNTAYGVGTKVVLSDLANSYIHTIPQRKTVEEVKYMPHSFRGGSTSGVFNFTWYEDGYNQYHSKYYCYSQATVHDPNKEIAEIVEPVYVELVSWQKKGLINMIDGTIRPDIFGGVLLYILVVVLGTLFFARLTIWIFATTIFILWLLNQYKA